jgi:hypothetical protein
MEPILLIVLVIIGISKKKISRAVSSGPAGPVSKIPVLQVNLNFDAKFNSEWQCHP